MYTPATRRAITRLGLRFGEMAVTELTLILGLEAARIGGVGVAGLKRIIEDGEVYVAPRQAATCSRDRSPSLEQLTRIGCRWLQIAARPPLSTG